LLSVPQWGVGQAGFMLAPCENIVLLFFDVSGITGSTSQCSTILPSLVILNYP
jgi:hypothetical protein